MSIATASRGHTDTRGVTVDEARYRLGNLGKTLFYDLVKQGKIRVVKIGNRTVVPVSEIDRLLSGVEEA
jgi:hypothetical protein